MARSKERLAMGEESWRTLQKRKSTERAAKWKADNPDKWKAYNVAYVTEHRRKLKVALVTYKGGKCEVCGYDKRVMGAFDFHHTDPDQKDFTISGKITTIEKLKAEVDKCQLVCKNCHAEIHEKLNTAGGKAVAAWWPS